MKDRSYTVVIYLIGSAFSATTLKYLVVLCGAPFLIRAETCTKKEVSIKNFFSKCDQIRSFVWIWLHLLKKSLMENFIFCAVKIVLMVF